MPKMKNSGVEWIGEIPEDWEIIQLSSLFSQHKEKNTGLKNNNLLSLSYGKIKQKDITATDGLLPENFEGYNIISSGDIVLRLTDLQNDHKSLRVGHSEQEGIITAAYITIRKRNNNLNTKYFYYLMHTFDVMKGFYGMGAGVRQGLSFDELKKLLLCYPSQSEQNAIVSAIESKTTKIDSLISNEEKQIEKLKAYKQALITETVTKGLDKNVKMKDSGVEFVGKIPNSWDVIKTGRLFKENNRKPTENDIPLSLSQVDGLIATNDMKESSLKTSTYENWKHVVYDDLVLNRFKAHLGVLFSAKIEGMVSFHYGVYEAKQELNSKYFEYLYHSDQYKSILGNMSNGMVIGLQNLSNQNFYSVWSLYPPIDVQNEIVEYLDKKCSQIAQLITIKEQKIKKLNAYKKSLIYEYVTGKKQVSFCEFSKENSEKNEV